MIDRRGFLATLAAGAASRAGGALTGPRLRRNRGLLSYGPDLCDVFRRVAGVVHRILRRGRPTELPVEQPTKIELVVNPKTAKALSLTLPPSLLLRTDQVDRVRPLTTTP